METPNELKTKPHVRPDYNAIYNDKKYTAGIRGFKEEIQTQRILIGVLELCYRYV